LKHHFKLYIRSKLVSPLLVGTAHAATASTQHGNAPAVLFYVVAAVLLILVALDGRL
jgi:hypothetical protein